MDSLLQLASSEDPKGSEFHSQGIINQMIDFQKKFKSHKNEVDASESEQKHTFDMAQAARKNKTKTDADSKADDAFIQDLASQCEAKAKAWDQRSSTRSAELTALAKALEVMKSEVAGNFGSNKKLVLAAKKVDQDSGDDEVDSLLEEDDGGLSFLQRHRVGRKHQAATRKAVGSLQEQAKALKSDALSALMIRMREDHFVKVRSMIKDMIAKLEADASAEADQKGWCDEEMEKATNQRDENIGHIEGDTASKTQANAKAIKLGEEIQELMQEVAEAKKGLSEATNLRSAEKAENAKTVEDATAGLAGVTKALGILKDFYDNAFVQTGSQYTPPNAGADGQTVGDMAPDTGFSNEDYHGNQDAASGILGMLEVIKSDFERTIDTTKSEESDADAEFQNLKTETETNISDKEDLIKTKEADKKAELGNKADATA